MQTNGRIKLLVEKSFFIKNRHICSENRNLDLIYENLGLAFYCFIYAPLNKVLDCLWTEFSHL